MIEPNETALLTPQEMSKADRLTIDGGVSGFALMKAAGAAIADVALGMIGKHQLAGSRIACLAGPGNNGGDAFVAGEYLRRSGSAVVVYSLIDRARLEGDAALAAGFYAGRVAPLDEFDPASQTLVIDGLFGAGLSRPIDEALETIVRRTNASASKVLSIDLPSGISGESGTVLGCAFEADRTVTFFRPKPGHYLDPGRAHRGELDVRQIGIESDVLETISPRTHLNHPALFAGLQPSPNEIGHKYDRGHAVVFSGPASKTGAARLAADAALRAGAGLVTLFSPSSATLVNASHVTAVMLERCNDASELAEHLADTRLDPFVLGPGFGIGERARDYARTVLEAERRLVLDADGISSFAKDPEALFALARPAERNEQPKLVLTPHAGEFKRLFPDLAEDPALSKLDRARRAAERSNAVVVLKGRDTVIADPQGRAAINATGTPWLATAGTGDVLTGMIAARLAEGIPSFEAALAGVWMHGKAAEAFGPGLIAEDLAAQLPKIFVALETMRGSSKSEQKERSSAF